jgi:hypothetical protein
LVAIVVPPTFFHDHHFIYRIAISHEVISKIAPLFTTAQYASEPFPQAGCTVATAGLIASEASAASLPLALIDPIARSDAADKILDLYVQADELFVHLEHEGGIERLDVVIGIFICAKRGREKCHAMSKRANVLLAQIVLCLMCLHGSRCWLRVSVKFTMQGRMKIHKQCTTSALIVAGRRRITAGRRSQQSRANKGMRLIRT